MAISAGTQGKDGGRGGAPEPRSRGPGPRPAAPESAARGGTRVLGVAPAACVVPVDGAERRERGLSRRSPSRTTTLAAPAPRSWREGGQGKPRKPHPLAGSSPVVASPSGRGAVSHHPQSVRPRGGASGPAHHGAQGRLPGPVGLAPAPAAAAWRGPLGLRALRPLRPLGVPSAHRQDAADSARGHGAHSYGG